MELDLILKNDLTGSIYDSPKEIKYGKAQKKIIKQKLAYLCRKIIGVDRMLELAVDVMEDFLKEFPKRIYAGLHYRRKIYQSWIKKAYVGCQVGTFQFFLRRIKQAEIIRPMTNSHGELAERTTYFITITTLRRVVEIFGGNVVYRNDWSGGEFAFVAPKARARYSISYRHQRKRWNDTKTIWLQVNKRDRLIVLDETDEGDFKCFLRTDTETDVCTIEELPAKPKVYGKIGIVPRAFVYMQQPVTIRFSPECKNMRVMYFYFAFNQRGWPQFLRADNYDMEDIIEDERLLDDDDYDEDQSDLENAEYIAREHEEVFDSDEEEEEEEGEDDQVLVICE